MNVSISSYYGSSSSAKNNAKQVNIGSIEIYFSYRTIIAFYTHTSGLVMRENDWGPTTGKHMNVLSDDKSTRVKSDVFLAKLDKYIGCLSLCGSNSIEDCPRMLNA